MQLDGLIERLAAFHSGTLPVISLYLDGRPDQHGRERYGVFVRKELAARARAWADRSPERGSFHRDVDRILTWLHEEARPSAHGLAIFACAGAADFRGLLRGGAARGSGRAAPDLRRGHAAAPAARAPPRGSPRYAAVGLDTQSARIFVFGLGELEATGEIEGEKTRRTMTADGT